MEQKRQGTDTGATPGTPDSNSDGVLKDLAAQAAALAPALETSKDGDPRRRGEIKVTKESITQYYLIIDGVMWAELDWSGSKNAWCIQDCMGKCLSHLEHVQAECPNDGGFTGRGGLNATSAIAKAKEMIRDGSMPSPEDARATYKKNHNIR